MIAISLAIAVGLAYVLVLGVLGARCGERSNFPFRCVLSAGLGGGFFSLLTFLVILLWGPSQVVLLLAHVAALAAVGALWLRRFAGVESPSPVEFMPRTTREDPAGSKILLALFLVAAFLALWYQITVFVSAPHGQWDAWSIWNCRARFIARTGLDLRGAFTEFLGVNDLDYPLHVPLLVSSLWVQLGTETVLVPGLVAIGYSAGTMAIVCLGLAAITDVRRALLGGILLVTGACFLYWGAGQYADVPAGFYLAASIVLLALDDCAEDSSTLRPALLAGLAAGLSAWVKNEGMMWGLAIGMSLGLGAVLQGRNTRTDPHTGETRANSNDDAVLPLPEESFGDQREPQVPEISREGGVEKGSFETPVSAPHLPEKTHACEAGTANRGNATSPTVGTPVRRPAGAAMQQKFLGIGVWGKGLLSRSPFPQKLHYPRNRFLALRGFALGLVPVVVVVIAFKRCFQGNNYLTCWENLSLAGSRILDSSRYWEIGAAFLKEPFHVHDWGLVAPLMILYACISGWDCPRRVRHGAATGLLSVSLILAGYFIVFLITPFPLTWHLETALQRLFVQLWPACVFLYCLTVRLPGGASAPQAAGDHALAR
ncbi:MAG: hypothetical protein AB1646_10305 [Thermodesulfobacteriota bacterium]